MTSLFTLPQGAWGACGAGSPHEDSHLGGTAASTREPREGGLCTTWQRRRQGKHAGSNLSEGPGPASGRRRHLTVPLASGNVPTSRLRGLSDSPPTGPPLSAQGARHSPGHLAGPVHGGCDT